MKKITIKVKSGVVLDPMRGFAVVPDGELYSVDWSTYWMRLIRQDMVELVETPVDGEDKEKPAKKRVVKKTKKGE